MGPFQLKSLAGNTYVIHFTDLESKYRVIYFMKSKEETKEMIERFYDHVKELGHELSILKRDNGTEFVNEGQRICEREVYNSLVVVEYTNQTLFFCSCRGSSPVLPLRSP
jgi:hypothetical protein